MSKGLGQTQRALRTMAPREERAVKVEPRKALRSSCSGKIKKEENMEQRE